jgi:plastocyanin
MFRSSGKIVIVVMGMVLLLAACSKSSTSSSSSGGGYDYSSSAPTTTEAPAATGGGKTATIDGQSVTLYGTADVSGKTSVKVKAETEAGSNYFSPTVITGTPGQTVKVEVTNESSSVPHNFSVDGQDVNVDLDPNATQTVSVTIPASGSVTFFCEYHRSGGMVGELKAA